MAKHDQEKEPLFRIPDDSPIEEGEVLTSFISRSSKQPKRLKYVTYGLGIAYLPLLILYALLAVKLVPSTASDHTIDLNLFPCQPFPMLMLLENGLMRISFGEELARRDGKQDLQVESCG